MQHGLLSKYYPTLSPPYHGRTVSFMHMILIISIFISILSFLLFAYILYSLSNMVVHL